MLLLKSSQMISIELLLYEMKHYLCVILLLFYQDIQASEMHFGNALGCMLFGNRHCFCTDTCVQWFSQLLVFTPLTTRASELRGCLTGIWNNQKTTREVHGGAALAGRKGVRNSQLPVPGTKAATWLTAREESLFQPRSLGFTPCLSICSCSLAAKGREKNICSELQKGVWGSFSTSAESCPQLQLSIMKPA